MMRRDFLASMAGAAVVLRPDALRIVEAASRSVNGATPAEVAQDEDFWMQIRNAFTVERNVINLNSGSVSPAPSTVQNAMKRYLDIMNTSPSDYVDAMLLPLRETVRQRLARAFGANPEEIAVCRNTTEALEIVQFGLELEPGDEILTTTQDYPSMLTSWRQRERRDGVVLKTIAFPTPPPSLDDLYARIERAVTPRTRVIMVCHITYTTGQIFPVRRICNMARGRGILTLIDGAHAFAHFPFDGSALGCDFYGTSLHKWLTAPIGTGFLYVRRDRIPDVWSLTGSPDTLSDDIRKFEQIGTHPVANWLAITEALTFNESIGIERKAARLRYLRNRWERRVEDLPGVRLYTPSDPEQACGIGSMSIEGMDANALTDYLRTKHRIHVRPRFVDNEFSCIRVSPNVFTTRTEVDIFAGAIEAAV